MLCNLACVVSALALCGAAWTTDRVAWDSLLHAAMYAGIGVEGQQAHMHTPGSGGAAPVARLPAWRVCV